jgi:two-component system, OmpR family, phosphate regulon sensor histidine kinase PhoR
LKNSLTNLTASSRSIGTGLVMLLLLAVLVPSACLLWFMNQAVKSEREAARQKLLEAYRGEIYAAQQTLAGRLRQISDTLEQTLDAAGPSMAFALAARSNLADAVICLNTNGKPIYPAKMSQPTEALPIWEEARELEQVDPGAAAEVYSNLARSQTNTDFAGQALQAQVRCLMQANRRPAALEAILQAVDESKLGAARDPQGRGILADLELLALEEFPALDSAQRAKLSESLRQQLRDYRAGGLLASQRRFLMRQMEALFPSQVKFETLPAEDLAATFLERSPSISTGDPGVMRAGSVPGVWQFSSSRGRILMLYRAEHAESWLAALALSQPLPSDTRLVVLAPGKAGNNVLIPTLAGDALPGWHLALTVEPAGSHSAGNQRIAAYVWIGFLVLAAILVIAALVLGLVRRQMALTQLRNDLVANVTHELKTPLSSMRLLVDTLLDSSKLDEQTTREYLQLIAAENVRLSRLIDNFLTFSRIERNKYTFKFGEVPAVKIVENAVAAVQDRFNVPGCELKVDAPAGLPAVEADSDAMVTALINLLDNAFKYTGDEKQILVSATAENGSVRFRVKDNGIGLSPRDSKRIFKRFYQVDQRLSRSGGGCGLGLSIVKFIVRAHHGNIEVESQPGKGSVFVVTLPVSTL